MAISDEFINLIKATDQITEPWVFRDFRHSFAINFLKAGGEIKDLQKIMGHQHPRMTEEIYGRYKTAKVDLD